MKINGDLKFRTLGDGELQNAIIERLASDPTGVAGRIYYNTTSNEYRYYDGSTWQVFGDVAGLAALQTEVDAIETASGGIFATDGTYDGTAVDAALSNVTGSTDLLDALTQLDAAIGVAAGVDTLKELTDVNVDGEGSPAAPAYEIGQMLFYDGSAWRNNVITGGIQVGDLLQWDGSNWDNVASSTIGGNAFGTVSGNTGSAVADATADTITIAGAAGGGITTVAATTPDSLSISLDINGLSGGAEVLTLTDTFAVYDGTATLAYTFTDLVQDLDIVNGITANGIIARTAADTYASRTITASTVAGDQGISVVNGAGVTGNPTIGLDITGLTAEAGTPSGTDVLAMFDGTNNVKVSIDQLASAMNSVLTLSELNDVDDALATNDGGFLYYDAGTGAWVAGPALTDNQIAVWQTSGSPLDGSYVATALSAIEVGSANAVVFPFIKASAGTINPGEVVYYAGFSGSQNTVELAQANSTTTMPAIGVAIETITNTTAGNVVILGRAGSFDTTVFGGVTGDALYVSATTAGELTNIRPSSLGDIVQSLAIMGEVGATGFVGVVDPGNARELPQFANANRVWQSNAGGTPTEVTVPTLLTFGELDDLSNVTGQPAGADSFLVSTGANAWGVESAADARTSLGLVAGGAGDIWVEKAGDTMTGDLIMSGAGTQVQLAAGTATDPALTFAADPNTGLNGAADVLSLVAGGTTRLSISTTAVTSTLPVVGPTGSAAAPTFTFTGETDIGMYNITTNTLGFAVAGTEALRINADGSLAVDGGGVDTGYAALVTEENDIPNKLYVDNAVSAATGALVLDDLTDVTATAPSDGDIMFYQAGSPAGWVIGQPGVTSGVQAQCAALDDFCVVGETTAADQYYYSTAAGTLVLGTITAAGRALIDDASDAAQRTTLGLVAGGAGDIWVEKAGDTMTGNLVMSAGTDVVLPDAPVNATDAANKAYVDQIASAITWRDPIVDPDLIDIVSAEPAITGSVGETFTYIKKGGTQNETWGAVTNVVDNDVLSFEITVAGSPVTGTWVRLTNAVGGERFIVAAEHGTAGAGLTGIGFADGDLIEYVSGDISTGGAWSQPEGIVGPGSPEMANGITVLVTNSLSYHSGHTYSYDALNNVWIEIAGPGSVGAGTGLSYSGTVLNVNLGAGIVELPSDEVGIDLYDSTSSALFFTQDGTTREDPGVAASKLHLLLGTLGGLEQDASGLRVDVDNMTAATIATADSLAFADATNANVASKTTVANFLADLDIPNAITANGIVVRTAADTYTSRSIVASTVAGDQGISVVNGGGIAGNPTIGLDITGLTAEAGTPSGTDTLAMFDGTNNVKVSVTQLTAGVVAAGIALGDLSDVTLTLGSPNTDRILRYNGTGWVDADVSEVLDQAVIGDLSDVTALNDTAGEVLVDAGSGGGLVPQAIQFNYDSTLHGGSATTHTVNHNLGQQFVNVTVYLQSGSPVAYTQVIPQSVTLNTANQLVVTFNSAIDCVIVVSGVPGVALA